MIRATAPKNGRILLPFDAARGCARVHSGGLPDADVRVYAKNCGMCVGMKSVYTMPAA